MRNEKEKVLNVVKVEILRFFIEELRGINSKAVYARKVKYYLYGKRVLRIIAYGSKSFPVLSFLKRG